MDMRQTLVLTLAWFKTGIVLEKMAVASPLADSSLQEAFEKFIDRHFMKFAESMVQFPTPLQWTMMSGNNPPENPKDLPFNVDSVDYLGSV